MITAVHTLIYSDDPDATRAFLRDVLGWPYVEDGGSGTGWLIFRTGPSELGVHPTSGEHEGTTYSSPRHHLVSLMCDDIEQTVAELTAKGAQFEGGIVDRGYGLTTQVLVPGADSIQIYQPQHETAYGL
jgi:catechol 2,3-dioxygenase-like lactoylglutathione lyase family enzyme